MAAPAADRLRETLALHTRLRSYRRHVDQARACVQACLDAGPVAVAFSGGKDSLVLLHLAHALDPRIGGYFFDSGCETDWTHATVTGMRDRGVPVTTLQPQYTIVEMIQMVGGLGYQGPQRLDGEWHWGREDFKRVLLDHPDQRAREMIAEAWPGDVTMLTGLRGEESRARLVHLASRGLIYARTDGRRCACPLAWWTGRDVLAYACEHELPLSAEYLQAGDDVDTRARRRTGTALGTSAVTWGRWTRLREQHPALWQDLAALFPEMRWSG